MDGKREIFNNRPIGEGFFEVFYAYKISHTSTYFIIAKMIFIDMKRKNIMLLLARILAGLYAMSYEKYMNHTRNINYKSYMRERSGCSGSGLP